VRIALPIVLALAGCDGVLGLTEVSGPKSDAGNDSRARADATTLVDSPPDVPADALLCYGLYSPGHGGLFKACTGTTPPTTFFSPTIDTGTIGGGQADCAMVIPQLSPYPEVCVIIANDITIDSTMHAAGANSRPLVLVATNTLTVNALVSVASVRGNGWVGAGETASECFTGPTLDGSTGGGGAGGGAGGSWSSSGQDGGVGGSGTNEGVPNTGGNAPAGVRGGCRGGSGAVTGTSYGHGGGAIYLIAGSTIHLMANARINASGEGGMAGAVNGGAGGGGSGGLIGLDAPTVTIDVGARLVANGGGGGGGGGTGSAGANGHEPDVTGGVDPFVASGVMGASGGGFGGQGAARAVTATVGQQGIGGGGGGGGAGYIYIFTTNLTAGSSSISPAPIYGS
jgi:hypothetical protein